MKRGILILLVLSVLLVGLVYADSYITGNSVLSTNAGDNPIYAAANNNSEVESHNAANTNFANAIKENNKLRFYNRTLSQCPKNCTCAGSTIKCTLPHGEREMTIVAGNSGNIIVQIKGINASTNVTLYKADNGKIYGIFAGNITKAVNMLPDQVREKIKEKIKARLENENITLNKDGNYNYSAFKEARLFFVIPVKVAFSADVDSQTGNLSNVKTKWWSFLARDIQDQTLVGASCGTVTPGQNNACCTNKGYDLWNATSSECEFNSSG